MLADRSAHPDPVRGATRRMPRDEGLLHRALAPMHRVPRWVSPTVLSLVVVIALLIGSGVGGGAGGSNNAQRAQTIEAQVRCPNCDDLSSVLNATTSVAVSVRHQVARDVGAGWSDQQIFDQLVARYGPSILLRPPTTGLTSVVWIAPAVGGAGAVAAVAIVFRKRARQMRAMRRGDR
jgi:cytochrome c-type biogenesis protein CcmH/NrfF